MDNTQTYNIFLGYDEREDTPFQVAKYSLEKHATVPIKVHKLHHRELRSQGMFTREWEVKSDGQYVCQVDGKPFSTQFSHTRFLVPELWRRLPDHDASPLVMFVDCDFLWLEDIGKMFKDIERKKLKSEGKSPVYCVHHNYNPQNTVKMDSINQSNYNMKLWSAMMVFDMDHPDHTKLTPDVVNSETGRYLHNFGWVSDEHTIDCVDEGWNYIPNHSEKNTSNIYAIHYTEGGPWFPNYRSCRYADVWYEYYQRYLSSKIMSARFKVCEILDSV